MSNQPLVLETLLKHSTWLNGILVPRTAIEKTLAHYIQPLVATNDDRIYPVSILGSCTALKFRERNIVICTRHQLRGWDPKQIALLTRDGKYAVTSGGVRHFQEINETDYHDLAAFDFTEPCNEHQTLHERFFNFNELPPDVLSNHIICLLAYGYPYEDQKYELAEKNHLGHLKSVVMCEVDGPNQPADEALMRLRPINPLGFDPDGMSGGGVFVLQIVDGAPHAYFAGIITRAGRDHVHIVKAPYIRRFIDTWCK